MLIARLSKPKPKTKASQAKPKPRARARQDQGQDQGQAKAKVLFCLVSFCSFSFFYFLLFSFFPISFYLVSFSFLFRAQKNHPLRGGKNVFFLFSLTKESSFSHSQGKNVFNRYVSQDNFLIQWRLG